MTGLSCYAIKVCDCVWAQEKKPLNLSVTLAQPFASRSKKDFPETGRWIGMIQGQF